MASGRESLIEFIEQYRELECLWKVTDKDYKNKTKRLNATEKLLQLLKKTDASANMDTVTKKINSLRSSFNKEHNILCDDKQSPYKVKVLLRNPNSLERLYKTTSTQN